MHKNKKQSFENLVRLIILETLLQENFLTKIQRVARGANLVAALHGGVQPPPLKGPVMTGISIPADTAISALDARDQEPSMEKGEEKD